MEPTYHPGDVAIVQSLRGRRPHIGQIVQINVPKEYQARYSYPSRVVHRVVKIEDGWVFTKGDNVGDPDPFKTRVGAVNRRVIGVIPSAGRLMSFVLSPFGLIWIAGGLVLFLVLPMREASESRQESVDRHGVTLDQLVAAVADYGRHLESHTEVVKGMSEASRSLAAVVARLEGKVPAAEPEPPAPLVDCMPVAVKSANSGRITTTDTQSVKTRRERPLRARRERPLRAGPR